MAVNGCLNGRTAVDLILSVDADVVVVVATTVVVVVVEFVVYSVSQERFFASHQQLWPYVVSINVVY